MSTRLPQWAQWIYFDIKPRWHWACLQDILLLLCHSERDLYNHHLDPRHWLTVLGTSFSSFSSFSASFNSFSSFSSFSYSDFSSFISFFHLSESSG